jgi:cytoskeleton protein RodZ
MQTIGEKLEEARKRRGISIREAAEVTKIRSDYLASFESNSFDLNVPAIYVRGFLRAYAQFLKLNPEKIMTDYSAHQLGESKFVRRESREFLGRMDIDSGGAEEEATVGAPVPVGHTPPPAGSREGFDYRTLDKSALLKGGIAVAGAGVLVAAIVLIVLSILKSGTGDAGLADAAAGSSIASKQEMTLLAEGGDILSVIVTEVSSGREIFRGSLPHGESRKIPFDSQVRLTYTHAEYLFIEQDGVRYSIGGRGMRQSTFPRQPQL